MKNYRGILGTEKHQELTNLARWRAAEVIRQTLNGDVKVITDISTCSKYLYNGEGHAKSGKNIPDCLYVYGSEIIIIEVGNYIPSKWPDKTVIHIGFGNEITLINRKHTLFEEVVFMALNKVIGGLDAPKEELKVETLDKRERLLMYLLEFSGLSKSEILNINIQEIDADNKTIYIDSKAVKLSDKVFNALDEYIEEFRRDLNYSQSDALFLTLSNNGKRERLGRQGIWKILNNVA